MKKKLKILQLLQKDFALYGVTEQQDPFFKRIILGFFLFSCAIISNGGYILFEATTFQEYANSIFFATALIAATAIYACTVWKKGELFNCINELDQIIDDSELSFFFAI